MSTEGPVSSGAGELSELSRSTRPLKELLEYQRPYRQCCWWSAIFATAPSKLVFVIAVVAITTRQFAEHG